MQVTVDTDYDDVLPSFNLVYDISDELLVRLGRRQGDDASEPGPA